MQNNKKCKLIKMGGKNLVPFIIASNLGEKTLFLMSSLVYRPCFIYIFVQGSKVLQILST